MSYSNTRDIYGGYGFQWFSIKIRFFSREVKEIFTISRLTSLSGPRVKGVSFERTAQRISLESVGKYLLDR